jgi:3-phenylpropionate/trans-cinnamate dioxygenase ferredoxin reductase subunit
MPAQEPIVIVGGGLAGAKVSETLRAEGYDGPVVLVAEEAELPYERPPLSKGYLLGKDARESAQVHDAGWYADHDVDLRTGVRATGLDVAGHRVELDTGEELRFGAVLLATGASARRLPWTASGTCGPPWMPTGCARTSRAVDAGSWSSGRDGSGSR